MRRTILILALAVCTVAYGGAKIEWNHTNHDFGAFQESMGAVTALFTLYNRGDETLVITGARANCGCTSPVLSADEIAPGDSATLAVTYDPDGRPGRFEKKIYIDSNTNPKRSTLSISGVCIGSPQSVNLRYPVEIGPLRMAHSAALLGAVERGHIKSVYESGYNASTDTLRPVVESTPRWLDVSVLKEVVEPGEGASFNFFVKSELIPEWDLVTDTVTIRPFAGSSDFYRMPVIITVKEDFGKLTAKDIERAPVASITSKPDEPILLDRAVVTTGFEITNNGKSPLKIRRVYTTTPHVRFNIKKGVSVKPGKNLFVPVAISDKSLGSAKAAVMVVTVVTNDPLNPRITFNVPIFNRME